MKQILTSALRSWDWAPYLLVFGMLGYFMLPMQATAADGRQMIDFADQWVLFPDEEFDGRDIASPAFRLRSGLPTIRLDEVRPVGAALLYAKLLPDPYRGTGLFLWPGAYDNQRIRGDKLAFSEVSAPQRQANTWLAKLKTKGNPFALSWWYRRPFKLGAVDSDSPRQYWLDIEAMNYTATVWLNGSVILGPVSGPYRRHPIRLPSNVLRVGENVIAIKVDHPGREELGYSWIDWIATPPDKMLGLRREPKMFSTGPARLRNTYFHTHPLNVDGSATLEFVTTIKAEPRVRGEIQLTIYDAEDNKVKALNGSFDVDAAGKIQISNDLRRIIIANPKLWWPHDLGEPYLYRYRADVSVTGMLSDRIEGRFGIRTVTAKIVNGHRQFLINDRPLFVNGAAWSGDMLHYEEAKKTRRKLVYIRHMGYNAIRQEGTLESSEFYEWTDELGVMVLGGYACCSHWESPEGGEVVTVEGGSKERLWIWDDDRYVIARDSLWSQLLLLAAHPSFLAWFNGSDFPPRNPEVERQYAPIYRNVFRIPEGVSNGSINQVIPYASNFPARSIFGQSGMKMSGPYEHVPPIYWYSNGDGNSQGGAFGFNTEHGPGITIDTYQSLADLDLELYARPNSNSLPFGTCASGGSLRSFALKQRSGTAAFSDGRPFFSALCKRYGAVDTIETFLRKVQFQNYEDHRALNEAHGRNRNDTAFGHIYWMGMNGWPSLRWHLFDYYLRTGGTFYGAKKGNQRIAIQYSYDDDSIWIVNRTRHGLEGAQVGIHIFDDLHRKIHSHEIRVPMLDAARAKTTDYRLPRKQIHEMLDRRPGDVKSDTFYLMLTLSVEGQEVSNFYWLSRFADILSRQRNDNKAWAYAVMESSARYESLARTRNGKPKVVHYEPYEPSPSETYGVSDLIGYRVTVENPEPELSIFWKIVPQPIDPKEGEEGEVYFQLWSDNFITLLPGARRELTVLLDKRWEGQIEFAVEPY